MGLADRLGDISPRALDDWVNGERDTPACIELSELAAGVKVAELRELAASLIHRRVRRYSAAEWVESKERKRVRRWLAEAVELRDGGYLRLLRGG